MKFVLFLTIATLLVAQIAYGDDCNVCYQQSCDCAACATSGYVCIYENEIYYYSGTSYGAFKAASSQPSSTTAVISGTSYSPTAPEIAAAGKGICTVVSAAPAGTPAPSATSTPAPSGTPTPSAPASTPASSAPAPSTPYSPQPSAYTPSPPAPTPYSPPPAATPSTPSPTPSPSYPAPPAYTAPSPRPSPAASAPAPSSPSPAASAPAPSPSPSPVARPSPTPSPAPTPSPSPSPAATPSPAVYNCVSDTNCKVCHSNGCDQCNDGFFKLNYSTPCQSGSYEPNCVSGAVTDFRGCQQCKQGYKLVDGQSGSTLNSCVPQ